MNNPQEEVNILKQKQEASKALYAAQKAMREGMKENTRNGKRNGGFLPKNIKANVQKIIHGHTFQSVSWIKGKQEGVENEIREIFEEFCKKYKKYSKSELYPEDATALYEAFVCNYESIRLYMGLNKLGNEKDFSRIAQLWDEDFIAQYFSNNTMIARELGITPSEVQENFGRRVKLRFAVNNISDPMGAIRRVKRHLDETLSDEAIMKELGITLEEVQENFGRGVKLHFAVNNIGDPMGAILRVKKHLDITLSDDAIMKELGITLEEVQENFGRSVKLRFSVGNIGDPMGAIRRVKKHLDETLSDEAIMRELGITLEEVQETFGRGVRLRFAVGNIGDPMGAIRRVKKHLDETLSDEAIMRELGITLEEVQENFGRGVKFNCATSNISDPMGALRRVKRHLDETLSDEAIIKEFGITLEEVQENFGKRVKLRFAISNISDPMNALKRMMRHLDETLSDEAIIKEFGITLEEVQENFGRNMKIHFAISNISDPMGALRRVKKNLDEVLSDEAIMKEFGITLEEVQENFGRGVKLCFAVGNILDPMEALKRVKKHLDETLSDGEIMRELGITLEEVQKDFGRGAKLRFAVGNASDPMKALRRVKRNLDEVLSDEAIMKEFGITLEEVQENFGKRVKLRFAMNNISDPMKALRRTKKHLDETLSNEAIMGKFGISLKEVQKNFGRSVKLYFAVSNIGDPLDGCRKWREGKISTPWTYKH